MAYVKIAQKIDHRTTLWKRATVDTGHISCPPRTRMPSQCPLLTTSLLCRRQFLATPQHATLLPLAGCFSTCQTSCRSTPAVGEWAIRVRGIWEFLQRKHSIPLLCQSLHQGREIALGHGLVR